MNNISTNFVSGYRKRKLSQESILDSFKVILKISIWIKKMDKKLI